MERSLVRMDLNLLKAMHILLEERNVARAAERLFITPSAMSKTLHRLRKALNDPLLVRAAGGLVPTPRRRSSPSNRCISKTIISIASPMAGSTSCSISTRNIPTALTRPVAESAAVEDTFHILLDIRHHGSAHLDRCWRGASPLKTLVGAACV